MKKLINKKNNRGASSTRMMVSSFIVDLRQRQPVLVEEISEEISDDIRRFFKKWWVGRSQLRRIKPDLLRLEKKAFQGWGDFLNRLRGGRRFSSWLKVLKVRRPTSFWREFSRRREGDFSAALAGTAVRLFGRKRPGYFERNSFLAANPDRPGRHPVFSFIFILVLIVIPFKLLAHFQIGGFSEWEAEIVAKSEGAVGSIMRAADALAERDLDGAEASFRAAGENFLAAQAELENINDGLLVLARFSSDPKIKLASESKNILAAGSSASSLGRNLVLATDSLLADQETDFSVRLSSFLRYGEAAVRDARSLEESIAKIRLDSLPDDYKSKFTVLSRQVSDVTVALDNFISAGEKIKSFLGLAGDKRYLVVFQNNAELRASGGFLGSYALVDLRDGVIKNLEVPAGGSYDTEAARKITVAAPEPLWLVDPLWHFWDANWWPDWPTTARNLMWFYENSGGPSVDGVISFTPAVIEDLLRVTGPIDMGEEYGLVIDADNFWREVKLVVERDNLALTHPEILPILPEKSTDPLETTIPIEQGEEAYRKPKKIIGDLLVKIMEVLPQRISQENLVSLLALFEDNVSGKHILAYFKDPILQSEALARNLGGELKDSAGDYLLVVHTNIAGQKTDRVVSDAVSHSSEVSADGVITNTLKITRTHNGIKREAMTGVRNVDWLRVYVPRGSRLISASGFRRPDEEYLLDRPEPGWQQLPSLEDERQAVIDLESGTRIYEEQGKQVFANWLMVDPGETAEVVIKYRLAKNFFDALRADDWKSRLNAWLNPGEGDILPYSLFVQKQPGAAASAFSSRLDLPDGWEIIWRQLEGVTDHSGWDIKAGIDRDKYWSVLLKKN